MLSTDLHNISDTLMAMALTGTPVPAEETPDLAFSDPRLSRFLPDPQARRAAA